MTYFTYWLYYITSGEWCRQTPDITWAEFRHAKHTTKISCLINFHSGCGQLFSLKIVLIRVTSERKTFHLELLVIIIINYY